MLEELKILNGDMPLKFDPLNTIYTVTLTSDDDSLELEYKLTKDAQISISGNHLVEGENEVILTVTSAEDTIVYYLYVYKEEVEEANLTFSDIQAVEINTEEEIEPYVVPLIAVSCFLVILLTFTLLFRKKKKSRF